MKTSVNHPENEFFVVLDKALQLFKVRLDVDKLEDCEKTRICKLKDPILDYRQNDDTHVLVMTQKYLLCIDHLTLETLHQYDFNHPSQSILVPIANFDIYTRPFIF